MRSIKVVDLHFENDTSIKSTRRSLAMQILVIDSYSRTKYSTFLKKASRVTVELTSVYGLLLIASSLLMSDMARLRTYIRPL